MPDSEIYAKDDISEDEARKRLCEALDCKPTDLSIRNRWHVTGPNPDPSRHQDLHGNATMLRQAVAQIVGALPAKND